MHTDNSSHLKEAIKHTEEAVRAIDAKAIAQHVEEAKKHAMAAQSENPEDDYIQEGLECLDDALLECLDDALLESQDGEADSARKAVDEALDKFYQAEQAEK